MGEQAELTKNENVVNLKNLLSHLNSHQIRGAHGVEVGSHTGNATRVLMEELAPERMVLVDPWAIDASYRNRAFCPKHANENLAAAEARMRSEFASYKNIEFLKARSNEAFPALDKHSFDWIYLDGCKYFAEILSDLEQSIALMKPKGVIFGAGWDWAPQLGFPVRAAVNALLDRLIPQPQLIVEKTHFALVLNNKTKLTKETESDRHLVISTMKNEAPFILEWIAHYRAIGFTDFLIYTNDCDDATVPLLNRLTERRIVRHEPNQVLRRGPHKSALKYAKSHWMFLRAKWVLICDVDEFLNLQNHNTIQEYLNSLPLDTDMVTFPWQVFGSGGIVKYDDLPVTEQFRHCEQAPDEGGVTARNIKTIFRRPREIDRLGLHRPRFKDDHAIGFVWRTPDGADISSEMNNSAKSRCDWQAASKNAYLNHYPIRAIQSYLIKKMRGRANHVREELGEQYFRKWDLNDAQDHSISRFDEARDVVLADLLSDTETERLHKKGTRQIRRRISQLMEKPAFRDLFYKVTGAPRPESKRSRQDKRRRKMLDKLPKGGIGAEIGVWEGRFSHEILEVSQPRTLHLIDPWLYLPEFDNVPFGRKKNAKRMGSMHTLVQQAFGQDKRVKIHRKSSQKALSAMKDNSLDWVYIDGNPNEPFFSDDLELSQRKVRAGGIIAGNNYYWKKEEGAPKKLAVTALLESLGDGHSLEIVGNQFIITLPDEQ